MTLSCPLMTETLLIHMILSSMQSVNVSMILLCGQSILCTAVSQSIHPKTQRHRIGNCREVWASESTTQNLLTARVVPHDSKLTYNSCCSPWFEGNHDHIYGFGCCCVQIWNDSVPKRLVWPLCHSFLSTPIRDLFLDNNLSIPIRLLKYSAAIPISESLLKISNLRRAFWRVWVPISERLSKTLAPISDSEDGSESSMRDFLTQAWMTVSINDHAVDFPLEIFLRRNDPRDSNPIRKAYPLFNHRNDHKNALWLYFSTK